MSTQNQPPFKPSSNPALILPNALRIPDIKLPKIPTEQERHAYESSATLIRRLATRIKGWKTAIPKDAEPVILAILGNGTVIDARRLSSEGHHGIVIEGNLFSPEDSAGATSCMVVAHQANLQLLCYVRRVVEPREPRMIGFGTGDADDERA